VAAVLAYPGVAAADATTTTASASFPSNLWVPAAAGIGASIIIVLVSIWASKCWRDGGLTTAIPDTTAWDTKDSWLTNITAIGTAATAIFTQSAVTNFLVSGVDKDGFTLMSILFGFAAALGPLVFAALASRPPDSAESINPAGTRGGLLLANVVTLFASFGLLADLGLLTSYLNATSTEKGIVYGSLGAAALIVGIYAIRATDVMINHSHAPATLMSPRKSGTL
jgi:hypothetical protein